MGPENMNIIPGAPLLESAMSQKQFIIKKSKKQRGQSKGATLMKAYFPNLIAKKDINMVSPTSLATRNQVPAQFGNTATNKKPKKFVKMSRSQHGSSAFASVYPAD